MSFLAEHSAWFDTEEYDELWGCRLSKDAACQICDNSVGRMWSACVVCAARGHDDCLDVFEGRYVCRECRPEGD